ncbi:MAG: hypothetical protein WBQ73_02070, partial [Candidatus Babeliales bacterium]
IRANDVTQDFMQFLSNNVGTISVDQGVPTKRLPLYEKKGEQHMKALIILWNGIVAYWNYVCAICYNNPPKETIDWSISLNGSWLSRLFWLESSTAIQWDLTEYTRGTGRVICLLNEEGNVISHLSSTNPMLLAILKTDSADEEQEEADVLISTSVNETIKKIQKQLKLLPSSYF